MQLTTFIQIHEHEILNEWDSFAKKVFGDIFKDGKYLARDHAAEILKELVADMNSRQSLEKQLEKSQNITSSREKPESAANIHGLLRHDDGLNVSHVVAEFRALRATVFRLWLPTIQYMSNNQIDEIMRFNESIDEAVADSIVSYEQQ